MVRAPVTGEALFNANMGPFRLVLSVVSYAILLGVFVLTCARESPSPADRLVLQRRAGALRQVAPASHQAEPVL